MNMPRERLTITLRTDLLAKIDACVDGDKIRNRSHAIEHLLGKALHVDPIKALILAGGKGSYDVKTNREVPKALLDIGGKPLLSSTIENLKNQGIEDIFISLGKGGQQIRDVFGNGSLFGVSLTYIEQDQSVPGTAQPLLQAEQFFSKTFLLLYGDVRADVNFHDVIEFHHAQRGVLATMVLTSVERVSMWGLVRMHGSKVASFEEKPNNPSTHSRLVNTGMYVMEPAIFQYISRDFRKLESDVFPRLAEEGKLAGYPFEGAWMDVTSG